MSALSIREYVPLAPLTTFGIGGPARWFVAVDNVELLAAAIRWAKQRGIPIFFLGGGSNLVISDDGFDGLVVRIELRGVAVDKDGDAVRLRAGAGEEWDPFVARCVRDGLVGVECLSGIPGTIGATPIQNVGAYGQDVAETIRFVDVLHRRDLSPQRLTPEECRFGYRSSFFKNVDPERYVITAVQYELQRNVRPVVRYPELRKAIEAHTAGSEATAEEVRRSVLEIRRGKGMVIDPADPDTRSAGSFFMNPLMTAEEFAHFEQRARELGIESAPPRYPAEDGSIKSSAAWIIERAGFHKGFGQGRVGISSKHTLALVNRGRATARELLALKEKIQQGVEEKFGVKLHPEPNFVGF